MSRYQKGKTNLDFTEARDKQNIQRRQNQKSNQNQRRITPRGLHGAPRHENSLHAHSAQLQSTITYFGVTISLYSCLSMSVAAAVAPYGITTLLMSKSARLFCLRRASRRLDELADCVRRPRDGRPGLQRGTATERPRRRPLRPKRRFRRKPSKHNERVQRERG